MDTVLLPLLPLLLIAPTPTLQSAPCASCAEPSAALVLRSATIDGVPLEEPFATEIRTADGTRTVWAASRTEPVGPRFAAITKAEAIAAVAALGGPDAEQATARLVWARTPVGLRLSWIVDPPADLSVPRNDLFRVDATTGRVTSAVDLAFSASAPAYPENPVTTPEVETYELSALVEPGDTLTHPLFDVLSCPALGETTCTPSRYATPDLQGDFGAYAPEPSFAVDDGFAETSAYVHVERFMAHMQGLGVQSTLCAESSGTRASVWTNYTLEVDLPWDDAYYTGACGAGSILLGQGAVVDWAYDADIVFHELGHAVVHYVTPTYLGGGSGRASGWSYDARAINEAIADVMAASYTGDPVIGESTTNRDIDSDAQCPTDLIGEQHNDSMPVSAALWQLRQAWEEAFDPLLLDVVATLPSDADYDVFAEAVATIAGASLGADAEALAREAFEAHGLVGCDRIVVLGPRTEHTLVLDPQGSLHPYTPGALQFAIDVPEGTAEASLGYAVVNTSTVDGPVNVAWRWDAPVEYTFGGEDGTTVSAVVDGGLADIEGTDILSFEPPTDGAHRLHISFSSHSGSWHRVSVGGVTLVEAPPGDPGGGSSSGGDTGTGDADPETTGSAPPMGSTSGASDDTDGPAATGSEGGCTVGTGTPLCGWLLLLLPLWARRRRARATPARGGVRAARD